jgi:glycosyltransferase involved in cell wall biosynthesis
MNQIVAIIPAYNEEKTIAEVLQKASGFVSAIIVVNDGSNDATANIAQTNGAIVISHAINRGLGAALGTGFEAAKIFNADVALTLDADGQHDPNEICRLVAAIENGADVVIGSRMMMGSAGMPFHRKIAQVIGNLVTFVLFGARVTDSQSGFRAFNRKALQHIEIRTNRMEVSSEIIAEVKRNKLKLVEVPISAIYTNYSLAKGQSFVVGVRTMLKLILRRLTQ